MKKTIYTLFALLAFEFATQAQYTFLYNDSITEDFTSNDYWDILPQHIDVINNTGMTEAYSWHTVSYTTPTNSILAFCDPQQCVDIPETTLFPFTYTNGDTGTFRFDVKPRGESGISCFRVKVYATADSAARHFYLNFCASVTFVSSVNELDNQLVELVTNPFHGQLQVAVNNQEVYSLELCNLQGQIIETRNAVNGITAFDKNLHSGIYLVRALDTNGQLISVKKAISAF